MLKNIHTYSYSLLLIIGIISCEKLELERQVSIQAGDVTEVSTRSAKSNCTIVDVGEGISQHGHCWSVNKNATVENEHTELGTLNKKGVFSSSIEKLNPQTQYYIRPYVIDKNGIRYGAERSFTTLSLTQPKIITGELVELTTEYALLSGTIPDLGFGQDSVQVYGHSWDFTAKEVLETYSAFGPTFDTLSFFSKIHNLKPGRIYHFRAYLKHQGQVFFGESKSFKALSVAPEVVIRYEEPPQNDYFYAIYLSSSYHGGDGLFKKFYICLDTVPNPDTLSTILDYTSPINVGRNYFQIKQYISGKKYFIRAYAANSVGECYSNQIEFQTAQPTAPEVRMGYITIDENGRVTCENKYKFMEGFPPSEYGVVWSMSPDATVADNTVKDQSQDSYDNYGNYEVYFDASPGDIIYLRSFALNQIGVSYSEESKIKIPYAGIVLKSSSSLDGPFELPMGSLSGEMNEQPIHSVELKRFQMGENEITNAQYCEFLNTKGISSDGVLAGQKLLEFNIESGITHNGSNFTTRQPNLPANHISWYGANAFCKWTGGRLPTEAEWEYMAVSMGNGTGYYDLLYFHSDNIDETAWYEGNSNGVVHDVNSKNNHYILNDISGNVREWCSDWYDENYYSVSPLKDPTGPASGNYKVLRGGSYLSPAYDCRNKARDFEDPEACLPDVGFRVVFDLE